MRTNYVFGWVWKKQYEVWVCVCEKNVYPEINMWCKNHRYLRTKIDAKVSIMNQKDETWMINICSLYSQTKRTLMFPLFFYVQMKGINCSLKVVFVPKNTQADSRFVPYIYIFWKKKTFKKCVRHCLCIGNYL